MKRDRIEFMVAHDCQGCLVLDHVADDMNRVADLGATVDEVAAKHGLAARMTKNAAGLRVTQLIQQFHEFVGVAVNVPNNVVDSRVLFVAAGISRILPRV